MKSYYSYLWTEPSPTSYPNSECGRTCSHGAEVQYIWKTANPNDCSDSRKKLMEASHDAWICFAKYGDPNCTEEPVGWDHTMDNFHNLIDLFQWSAVESKMVIDPTGPTDSKDMCEYWDDFDMYTKY